MKNLKKVLALVLAFACAFTMFAGAADFTDKESINEDNLDAVNLLTTLKIIDGYEDGSFKPEETVNRAQMAKMIYTIRNGGNSDASAYEAVSTTFEDLDQVDWAKGYIKYLQNTGIIAGRSEKVFDPAAPVTTIEAYKMALVLGGYRADKAELTGPKWINNTVSLATTNRLDRNVKSAINAGCSRQDAAQILANTLEMTAVQWSEFVNGFVNDSEQGLAMAGNKLTVGGKWMDLVIYVGKMVSAGDMRVRNRDNATTFAVAGKDRFTVDVETEDYETYFPNTAGVTSIVFKDGEDHTDLVGLEVKVLRGKNNDKVFGVFPTGKSKVVETEMCDIDYENINRIKVEGERYEVRGASVYVDNDINMGVQTPAFFTVNGADNQNVADRVKLIDYDDDDVYETIICRTVAVAEVTSVTSSSITVGVIGSRDNKTVPTNTWLVENNTTLDLDDNTIYEDVAKGDYAIVTLNPYDNHYIVEKADMVSGKVDGKVDNEFKVRLDGDWYTLANDGAGPNRNINLRVVPDGRYNYENGDAITLYAVGNIAYYAKSTAGNDKNRAVLMVYNAMERAGGWNDTAQAKVILADGTKLTVNINSDPAGSCTFAQINANLGQMYYYEINNDGDYAFYNLTPARNAGYEGVNTWNGGVVNDRVNGTAIDDDSIVFALLAGNDAKVYTGRTVKDANIVNNWGHWTTDAAKYTTVAGGVGQMLTEAENNFTYARMFNVDLRGEKELDTTTDYGWLLRDSVRSRRGDGKYQMEYIYWNGNEIIEAFEVTDTDRRAVLQKNNVMSFSYVTAIANNGETETDVEIKDVEAPENVVYAAMEGVSGKSVVMRSNRLGAQNAEVDGDTVIFHVDSHAADEEDIGVSGKTDYDYRVGLNAAGRYPCNTAYILDNDGNFKLMVIDVEGSLKGQADVNPLAGGVTAVVGTGAGWINEVQNADTRTVNVSATATIAAGETLNISEDKIVNFNGLVLNGTMNGDATAETVGASNGTLNGKLTVNKAVPAGNLDNIVGFVGSDIELKVDYNANTANKFFFGDLNAPAAAGDKVPAGIYRWTSVTDADNNVWTGWVGKRLEAETVADSNGLVTALARSNDITVNTAFDLGADIAVDADQTVTFNADAKAAAAKTITVEEGGKVVFNKGLDLTNLTLNVKAGGEVTINAEAADSITAKAGAFKGAGTIVVATTAAEGNQPAATALENIDNSAALTLDLRFAAATPSTDKWAIGSYTLNANDIAAMPAAKYVAKTGVWTLSDAYTGKITMTGTTAVGIANSLTNMMSAAKNLEVSGVVTAAQSVPAGAKLTLTAAPTSGIKVDGELVMTGDMTALNLALLEGTQAQTGRVTFSGLTNGAFGNTGAGVHWFYFSVVADGNQGSDQKMEAAQASGFNNRTFKCTQHGASYIWLLNGTAAAQ